MRKNLKHVAFFVRFVAKRRPSYVVFSFLSALIRAVRPFILVFLPMIVIDYMVVGNSFGKLAAMAGIGGMIWLIPGLCANAIDYQLTLSSRRVKMDLDIIFNDKVMHMPYEKLEDPVDKERINRAVWMLENYGGVEYLFRFIFQTLVDLVSIVIYAVVLFRVGAVFFGIVCVCAVFCFALGKRREKVNVDAMEAYGPLNRLFLYHLNMPGNPILGREIRLFGYEKLVVKKTREMIALWRTLEDKVSRKNCFYSLLQFAAMEITRGGIYVYLTGSLFRGGVSVGAFFSYIMAINNFSYNVLNYFTNYIRLSEISHTLAVYREILEMDDADEEDIRSGNMYPARKCVPFAGSDFTIEFSHVSFRYPNTENYVLNDVCFSISPGEHVALVGLNGSGKSTIAKLLCGLYEPTEGAILLNGMPINQYANYHELLTVIFQDSNIFPATVRENIEFDRANSDRTRINELLARIDFPEMELEKMLGASFDESAVDLSGGENQKLAIVRALYKGGRFLIMDEPTASLDPLVEYEIFRHMRDMIAAKTALIISHRLFSCRYCTTVFVIDGGRIIERGSHDTLLNKEGFYKALWEAQAKYYI